MVGPAAVRARLRDRPLAHRLRPVGLRGRPRRALRTDRALRRRRLRGARRGRRDVAVPRPGALGPRSRPHRVRGRPAPVARRRHGPQRAADAVSARAAARSGRTWRAIPGSIWALGFVSMFMDVSSEMIHSLLPVFLVSVLGASPLAVGLIEGVAEATASVTKIFSGTLSDYLCKRKLLASAGYGLAALTKPLFRLAPTVGWVLTARFVDRIGKGIRGAPRDALVGDLAPPSLRGACYGLRQSLDTVGAFAGPLLAIVFMSLTGNDFRLVFWIAVVPAFIAVALLIVGVREPEIAPARGEARVPIRGSDIRGLGSAYWWLGAVPPVFTLAPFRRAFPVRRAQDLGLPVALVPLVMVVMNVAYALSAYPAGYLSDHMDRRTLVTAGAPVPVARALRPARATGAGHGLLGVGLWGLHMGRT